MHNRRDECKLLRGGFTNSINLLISNFCSCLHLLNLGLAGSCKIVGGSRDVPGCPMGTWDNSDLGLGGWC